MNNFKLNYICKPITSYCELDKVWNSLPFYKIFAHVNFKLTDVYALTNCFRDNSMYYSNTLIY